MRAITLLSAALIALIALAAAACSQDGPASPDGAVSGSLGSASADTPEEAAGEESSAGDGDRGAAPGAGDESAATPDDQAATVDAYEPFADPAPLPADPRARIGTLANGLKYYLRHNDNPGDNLDLRLLVDVGSVDETDASAGIAHFIEHLLFTSTEAYPDNTLTSTLRDLGVELGPDLNARVSHDETAFEVTVGTDASEKVRAVFHALSQMAHAAVFDPEAMTSERGVVLDEMRSRREAGSGRIVSEFDRIYTRGTPYEGRDPLGSVASLESMTADDLRAFYETWYVPSNMAVVAVGDWPVDDLEALMDEFFGPIPPGEAPPFAPVEAVPDPEPSTHVVTDDAQGFSYISLDIAIPRHDTGTVGGERLQTMEKLIELMVSNRLTDAYHRGELSQVDPPGFLTFDVNKALRYYGTNWQGEDLDAAMTDYLSVLLTAQENGFTDSDAARAAEQLAAGLRFELDGAATIQDWQYAQRYEYHFLRGADLGTTEDRVERNSALLDELTAGELSAHYRWLMARAGPLVIAVGPDPSRVPSTSDLDAALAAAAAGPPPPDEPDVGRLMLAPAPQDPVRSGPLPVLDGYEWEFANGARVMFAESDIAEGVVSLEARSLGGWSRLSPGSRALSPRAAEAVFASGLGDLTRSQLNRFLDDSTASLSAFIAESTEGFSGGSGRDDAETLFQMLHLYATAPRVDERAFLQALNEAEIRTSLSEVNPDWRAWLAYNEARFDDDWHRPVATREQLASLTADSLLSIYERRLGKVDDMIVAVVGDIEASEVERLARRYVGTLPAGDRDTYANRRPREPSGVVRRVISLDEGQSAVLQIYQEARSPVAPRMSAAADVLAVVLDERLVGVFRDELGASYTSAAQIASRLVPRPGYTSAITVTFDPVRLDEIHARVLAIIDDLAVNAPAADEFEQAVAVVANNYSKIANSDLIRALISRLHLGDDHLVTPERRTEAIGRLSPADVQSLAAALYGDGDRIEIVSTP